MEEIRRHAEKAYPEECCGILLGHVEGEVRRVVSAVRCRNAAADSRRTRYEIDSRELIQIQREGRERGYEIVGFYHSHPDQAAEWSAMDLDQAYWVGCSYVIVGVERGNAKEIRSFELAGDKGDARRFVQEKIELV
jgi:proteasome lid subunit RPN8/RPN11